jgi:hypothetical protein
MAIWQYKLYFLPEEEVKSYFPHDDIISEDAFNEVEWWKYRQLDINNFVSVNRVLASRKSWSDDIIMFGELDSNCFEVLTESGKMVEVSARIDLRFDYRDMIKLVCQFGAENKLILLNYKWDVLPPEFFLLERDIANYKLFDDFLNKVT